MSISYSNSTGKTKFTGTVPVEMMGSTITLRHWATPNYTSGVDRFQINSTGAAVYGNLDVLAVLT